MTRKRMIKQFYCRRLAKYVIEGDMTGEIAGMVGSVYG